jgi:DNA-binding response OmpR family regulator
VVDDEPATATLIGRVLERHGWQALVAEAPERALALGRRARIHLLITDFEMPGMNGLDLAAQFWRSDADLPVVVVSGWPEAAKLAVGPRLAFVPKPLDMAVLLSRVAAIAPAPRPD